MTALRNLTPFANMQFANWDAKGREFGVYMVKTAWDILPDGSCHLSDEQEPFVFTDEFYGEVNETAVRYASDMVPYKPKTDIILSATAYAPDLTASSRWESRIDVQVDGTDAPLIDKALQIYGPRQWKKGVLGWKLTEATPITQCDLRFDYAYGGAVPKDEDQVEAYEMNPVGKGFADKNRLSLGEPFDAPQILNAGEVLKDPSAMLSPAGVGPVQAAWLPRRPRGGTYDKHWEDNVWPLWPDDYDFAFHNAATDDMTIDLPLGKEIKVALTHMHPELPEWVINVPNPRLAAYVQIGRKVVPTAFMTDTIYLDIAADRMSDPRIFQVSRLVFDLTQTEQIVLMQIPDSEDMSSLAKPPHPHEVAQYIPEDESEIPA